MPHPTIEASPRQRPDTSARVRPSRIDARATGSDRNRSMMPLPMSSATSVAVLVALSASICTKMPGIRNSL